MPGFGKVLLVAWIANLVQTALGISIEVLSSIGWESRARILVQSMPVFTNVTNPARPFACEFENVYADIVRIYFIPKTKQAASDLLRCCYQPYFFRADLTESPLSRCNGTVSAEFCLCFYRQKYVPSVWSEGLLERRHALKEYSNGPTWLMNHWCTRKHIDHFGMKYMELIAYAQMRAQHLAENQCCASSLPKSFDHIVSMDYNIEDLTDYEQMVTSMAKIALPNATFHTLNPREQSTPHLFRLGVVSTHAMALSFCYFMHDVPDIGNLLAEYQLECVNDAAHEKLLFTLAQLAHFGEVMISPNYKNTIPRPYLESSQVILETFHDVSEQARRQPFAQLLSKRYPCPAVSFADALKYGGFELQIAIIQRGDTTTPQRRFVNLDDVQRTVREVFKSVSVNIWYINAETPALQQAQMFCSAHLIISPHSSQLSNLIFANPNASVIEIQIEGFQEPTFQQLATRKGLDYTMLVPGNILSFRNGTLRGFDPKKDVRITWASYDTTVNITLLEETLRTVRQRFERLAGL